MEKFIKFSDLEKIIEQRERRWWEMVDRGTAEDEKTVVISGFAVTGEYITLRSILSDLIWQSEEEPES